MSTEQLKGGAKASDKRKFEKEEARTKSYELTPSAARAQKEKADAAKNQNNRADQYEADKEKAKKFADENGFDFKEEEFKEDYEKGENLKNHGLNKKVDAGSVESVEKVETVEEVNSNRRQLTLGVWKIQR